MGKLAVVLECITTDLCLTLAPSREHAYRWTRALQIRPYVRSSRNARLQKLATGARHYDL